jgi:predicted nucleotidyltransferase
MSMTPRVERALFEGIAALDELGLRYAVVGGLAIGVWAVPRATRDVDLYAELPLALRPGLEAALVSRGFDVPAMAEELSRYGVFRSKLRKERVFLDIFDGTGPLGEAILQRRKQLSIGGRVIWFVSAEDLAVLKAFSDRQRDLEDLVALLALPEGTLDLGYVDRWARLLDESIGGNEVSERLATAHRLAEARNRGTRRPT